MIVNSSTILAGQGDQDAPLRSTDGGVTWSQDDGVPSGVLDSLEVLAWLIASLTIPAPQGLRARTSATSSTGPVYAGTAANGVFKSLDTGVTWSASGLAGKNVDALAIDPATPSTVYAGTFGSGVYKSLDSGATWNAVNSGMTAPFAAAFVLSLAIDPTAPDTIYAGTSGGGAFKSTNGGSSWTAVEHRADRPLRPQLCSSIRRRRRPSTQELLYNGFFVSTDGGATWTAQNSGLVAYRGLRRLAVDPQTPATIYAGTFGNGVSKSNDGGAHWTRDQYRSDRSECLRAGD